MGDPVRVQVGDVSAIRVEYFDIALEPDAVGLDRGQVAGVAWAVPTWATPDGEVRAGQAMWVLESSGSTIVVDPCGASDDFLRSGPDAIGHQEAMLGALVAAGVDPHAVDLVVLTHLDGIGTVASVDAEGRWSPTFAHARVVVTARELDFLAGPEAAEVSGLAALRALVDHGVVDPVAGDHALTDEVRLEHTGAHSPGHAVVRVRSQGAEAVLLGHLAVTPLQLATGVCEALHREPEAAHRALSAIAADAAGRDAVLIGPLWPHPGAGRVDPTDPTRLLPVGG